MLFRSVSQSRYRFVQGSAAMAGSRSPASGGAAATAAPVPSMQAFKPNFSNVFQSLASLAQAKASEASAGESGSRARQTDTVTPLLSDYYRGLTNWKNLSIGASGYWNKETGRISAALDQSTEAQNLKNAQFAERISAAQETQILLNSAAQRIINKYMDQNQQADLFIKVQTLANLRSQGVLTEVCAPVSICVTTEFANEEMFYERRNIKCSDVAKRVICIVGTVNFGFHGIKTVFDVVKLLIGDFVVFRIFNCDRRVFVRRKMFGFRRSIGINFNQITTCYFRNIYTGRIHFCDVNTFLPDFKLVAKLVATLVFTVDNNIYQCSSRSVVHFETAACFKCYEITNQSFISPIS